MREELEEDDGENRRMVAITVQKQKHNTHKEER
jgi:hypothetical protein